MYQQLRKMKFTVFVAPLLNHWLTNFIMLSFTNTWERGGDSPFSASPGYGNIRRGMDQQDKRMYAAKQGVNEFAFVDEHILNVFTTGTVTINDATAGADNTYTLKGAPNSFQ